MIQLSQVGSHMLVRDTGSVMYSIRKPKLMAITAPTAWKCKKVAVDGVAMLDENRVKRREDLGILLGVHAAKAPRHRTQVLRQRIEHRRKGRPRDIDATELIADKGAPSALMLLA